ncbi:MAG: hypothetical protein WC738_07235, partial [Candidatus Omnitrophota bacterium]
RHLSDTYYAGEKGDEIADYSYNFAASGEVKTTSKFYYGSGYIDAIAESNAGGEDAMTKSSNFKGQGVAGRHLSDTFYVGEKGDEIADHSDSYGSDGSVKLTSRFYYGAGYIDATAEVAVGGEDAMTRSDAYKNAGLQAKTYYAGEKGDEIADYSLNYKLGTTTVQNTVVYWYSPADNSLTLVSAENALSDYIMRKQLVYRLDHTAGSQYSTLSQEVFFVGTERGEEIADSAKYYTKDGLTVIANEIYYYGSGSESATAATANDDALAKKIMYRLDNQLITMNETYYDDRLGRGEEIIDYVWNYQQDGSSVFSTTLYEYGSADSDSSLVRQRTYLGALSSSATLSADNLISTVDYSGEKGAEHITKITDRKGVEQVYAYADGNLSTVTIANGTTTYYKKDNFMEDIIDYSEDYRGIKTTYVYDDYSNLLSTWYEQRIAAFSLDGVVGVTVNRIDTYYEKSELYEDRVKMIINDQSGTTVYYYSATTFELTYTFALTGVGSGELTSLKEAIATGDTDAIDDFTSAYVGGSSSDVGVTTTYYQKNTFGETVSSLVIQSNGVMVQYKYEEIKDPTNSDKKMTFRTVITRTSTSSTSSSFDSISVLDKYGDLAITIDSSGVTQYTQYLSEFSKSAGSGFYSGSLPTNIQTSVLNSKATYDLNGRLLTLVQEEVDSFVIGTQTYYLPVTIIYTYGYTLSSAGEIESAVAKGCYNGTSTEIREQYFDDQMRLTKVYEWIPDYDDDGKYIGDVWGCSQAYTYWDTATDSASLLQNILDSILGQGNTLDLDSSTQRVVINGVEYTIDPDNFTIHDDAGNTYDWEALQSMLSSGTQFIYPISFTQSDGTVTSITVAISDSPFGLPVSGLSGTSGDDAAASINVNGQSYSISPNSVNIVDSNGISVSWDTFINIYNANGSNMYVTGFMISGTTITDMTLSVSSVLLSSKMNGLTGSGEGNWNIDINGTSYSINSGTIKIFDNSGNPLTWADFVHIASICGNSMYLKSFAASDGEVTSITLKISSGDIGSSQDNLTDNGDGSWQIDVGGTTYNVDGLTVRVFDSSGNEVDWADFVSACEGSEPPYIKSFVATDNNISEIHLAGPIPDTDLKVILGTISVGGTDVLVFSDTEILGLDGNPITAAQFFAIYNANPDATYIKITKSNISGGRVRADKIELLTVPTENVTGIIDNLYNPNGLSVMNGVVASTASNTISFYDVDIKILDDEGTIITDSEGNSISGTAAEKVAKLESIRQNIEAQGGSLTIKLVAMKNGSDWEAKQIIVTSDELFLAAVTLTGSLTSIDNSTWQVVFDGKDMNLDNVVITDINGLEITKEELYQFWQDNISNGAGTFATVKAEEVNGEWDIETVTIISDATGNAAMNGLISDVSYTTSTSGTIRINGELITITDSTGIIKDAVGNEITLEQLSEIFAYNNICGITTKADVLFNITGDGLILTGLDVLTVTESYLDMSSVISVIDLTGGTITFKDGIVCYVNDDTEITDSSGNLKDLVWLNTIFTDAVAGGDTCVTVDLKKDGNNWIANTIRIAPEHDPSSSITSSLDGIVEGAGTFGVYATTGIITIGGIAMYLTADTKIEGANNLEITLAQLKAIFDSKPDSQILVAAVMAKVGDGFVVKEIYINNIINTSKSINSSSIQIVSYDDLGNPKEILIDGVTVEIGNDAVEDGFFTNIEISYLNIKNNSVQLGIRNSSQASVNNSAYDAIGGLKGLVLHEYTDIVSATTAISFNAILVKVGDTWRAEKITADANLGVEAGTEISGLVGGVSISAEGNIITLDGVPITVKGNIIQDASGKYYTLSEFASLYNENTADGVDTYLSGTLLRGYALQTGQIGDSQESVIRKEVVLGTDAATYFTLHFKWKVSSESDKDYFRFFVDGAEVSTVTAISGETGWQDISVYIAGGAHTLEWKYIKDDGGKAGFDAAWLDDVVIEEASQTVSFTPQVSALLPDAYETEGDSNFFSSYIDTEYQYAAQAGTVYNGGMSVLQREVDLTGITSGTAAFTFKWKTSSGGKSLKVEVYKDGVLDPTLTQSIDGDVAWQSSIAMALAAGSKYTIKWTYTNSDETGDSTQTAWIDNVNVATDQTDNFDYFADTQIDIPDTNGYTVTTNSTHGDTALKDWFIQNAVIPSGTTGFAVQTKAVYGTD